MDGSAATVRRAAAQPSESAELTSSFERFVDTESVRFHGALRLLTRDRAEAEDLMQDAFLKVWERWAQVRTLDDPTGYLYRTAMNLYRKRLRRAGVALRHVTRARRSRDELEEVEARDTVLRALATLTPRQRMSLVLTDLLDLPSDEAGRVMGVKPTTVRALVSQGRSALRNSMGDDIDV
jgi:RNA polymerase sigma-70 factor (ECF subfamily)